MAHSGPNVCDLAGWKSLAGEVSEMSVTRRKYPGTELETRRTAVRSQNGSLNQVGAGLTALSRSAKRGQACAYTDKRTVLGQRPESWPPRLRRPCLRKLGQALWHSTALARKRLESCNPPTLPTS